MCDFRVKIRIQEVLSKTYELLKNRVFVKVNSNIENQFKQKIETLSSISFNSF